MVFQISLHMNHMVSTIVSDAWTHQDMGYSLAKTDIRDCIGPTKMFLLVCGHFQEGCIPAGFMYKRGFQIRMKKGMQVCNRVCTLQACWASYVVQCKPPPVSQMHIGNSCRKWPTLALCPACMLCHPMHRFHAFRITTPLSGDNTHVLCLRCPLNFNAAQVHMSLTGAAYDESVTTSFMDPASGQVVCVCCSRLDTVMYPATA